MITVVYACDDAYVRQTLVSMVSVLKHNPGAKLYLIMDGMSQANQELIVQVTAQYGQVVQFSDIGSVLPDVRLDDRDRHPRTIYAKLFLENVINDDRVLYLDSDVVVDGSLEELFVRDMECELAAGVLMPYSTKVKAQAGVQPGEPYICDGVVLFNMKLWKRMNKAGECRDYIEQYSGRPAMLSEGTLNHVCRGMMGTLEPKYNLMPSMLMYSLKQIRQLFRADYYYQDEAVMREARERPVGIHFMNELYNRPWFEPCDHPLKKTYRMLENELLGYDSHKIQYIQKKTRLLKILYKLLPFQLFTILYQAKQRIKDKNEHNGSVYEQKDINL